MFHARIMAVGPGSTFGSYEILAAIGAGGMGQDFRAHDQRDPGDDALLGATTLDGFGLVLEPFRRELRPMQLPLKKTG